VCTSSAARQKYLFRGVFSDAPSLQGGDEMVVLNRSFTTRLLRDCEFWKNEAARHHRCRINQLKNACKPFRPA